MAKQAKPLNLEGVMSYTEAIGRALVSSYEAVSLDFSAACDKLAIPSKTAREWLVKHPSFAAMVAEVDARATDAVKAALFAQAKENPTAARLFLDLYGGQATGQVKPQVRQADPMNAKESIKTLKGLLEKETLGNSASTDF